MKLRKSIISNRKKLQRRRPQRKRHLEGTEQEDLRNGNGRLLHSPSQTQKENEKKPIVVIFSEGNNTNPSNYRKTPLKRPLEKKTKIGFQDRLSLNAAQKYCRMLQDSILQYFRPSLSNHLSLRPLGFFYF